RRHIHDALAGGLEALRDVPHRDLSAGLRAHRLDARHRLRSRRHLLPDVRAAGARAHLAAGQELLDALALFVLRADLGMTVRTRRKEGPMNRTTRACITALLIGLVAVSLGVSSVGAQTIKMGNLVDLTGPTSDQGKDIAQGRTDAVQYFNEKGGING